VITIECPFCEGDATTDETLSVVACDGCGSTLDVAADPAAIIDVAA
jgi:ribosomal protein S27E